MSRVWHHIITGSKLLQQALFTLPVQQHHSTGRIKRADHIKLLLKEILWPQLSWLATSRHSSNASERKREAEARDIPVLVSKTSSCRLMLIRQPPTITIGNQGADDDAKEEEGEKDDEGEEEEEGRLSPPNHLL